MADLATQSANPVANKPASTIGGNAPPTPPETQEVKSANPTSTLPASADEPAKTNETSSVPVPASTSETEPSKGLGESETAVPVNGATTAPGKLSSKSLRFIILYGWELAINASAQVSFTLRTMHRSLVTPQCAQVMETNKTAGAGTDSVKAAEAEADQLAAQPEKPSDNLTSSAPINAKPSAAAASTNEELSNEPPKPVSLEEVPDPEGPTTKLKAAEDVVSPEPTKEPAATAVSEEKKDAEVTDAQPTVTTGPSQPEAVPAVSELVAEKPKSGQKRKAEEPAAAAVNGDEAAEQQAPAAKKQKESPIKRVADKVSNTIKKVGRPKKEKKEPAPVGKTARKTRSQGKADE
ncbi:hypothetical protein PFICI_01487 [Pestalotiopsis fici W106-1]|uniref:Uncharacterized protein n=1 Tax=Pestalotiopsis fici (strain W106-1 / CGMCC3.15140) TaxID=1229662 RepID=W3XNV7_PESFW|nr:uncharacterized protein PFICI_01487 [Pestalotiopsis fici W106-1]ETS87659.1 hypothetical protein PFICI_01487 [Pestalotiopsis fici W106-1]